VRQGFVLLLLAVSLAAGSQAFGQRLLRLYEDDDYINIKGKGTDEAYTNGSRVDLFYTLPTPTHTFPDRILPKAGDSTTDVYGWGIMQVMYTPRRINDADFQPDDYPWSGGLFLTHSLYSYNPRYRCDIQTEVVAGVLGPASLAGATQKGFHHLIHYTEPTGWGHQFRNDLLLNINLTLEKEVFELRPGANPLLELIGGGTVHAGTMENRLSFYSLLRLGLMHPYFNGLMSQYTSSGSKGHMQLYLFARPEADLVGTNAILQGGMFTHPPHGASTAQPGAAAEPGAAAQPISKTVTNYQPLRTFTYNIDYGAVLAFQTWSLSFTQSWSSALMRGLYNHEVGNISVYFGL